MKLQDLKRGMQVLFRNSEVEIFNNIDEKGYFYTISGRCYECFNDDLTNAVDKFSIVAVFDLDGTGKYHLIWKRKEDKYILQCPITKHYLYKNDLNEYEWEYSGTKILYNH